MRKGKGFTLIEIMMVVAILGILISVVLPRLTGRSEEARINAAKLQIGTLEMALETFEMDNFRFPTTFEGLQALREKPIGLENWKGPYLKKSIPRDPWKEDYVYTSPGVNNVDFDLYSSGPDLKQGSDDDIGNW